MFSFRTLSIFLTLLSANEAFQSAPTTPSTSKSFTQLATYTNDSTENNNNVNTNNRRAFLTRTSAAILGGISTSFLTTSTEPAQAVVYLDPAMYGDQENRLSAVDSLKESVRRAILQKPQLAPIFYSMALLDGLSYNAKTGEYGPDGRIVFAILASDASTPYMALMKDAANVIVESKKSLKKLTSITIADAVALAGTEAIEAVGGPNLSVQVGRTDAPKGAAFSKDVPLDLFEGKRPITEVRDAFTRAGLTEREMTALLGALMTVSTVEKDRNPEDWKRSGKQQFRERGKIGRMSEYKRLSDEDIEKALTSEFEDDEDDEPGLFDDQPYIADTFGTRDQAFGRKAGDLDVKSFNKYLQELNTFAKKPDNQPFGWIGSLILDRQNPGAQIWLGKYAQSYLNYQKDLGVAFNSLTQLGGEYTGGKYENLLKNKPRKTLNDA